MWAELPPTVGFKEIHKHYQIFLFRRGSSFFFECKPWWTLKRGYWCLLATKSAKSTIFTNMFVPSKAFTLGLWWTRHWVGSLSTNIL
jgi:hypothetical protein